ncbi:hypothetical protein Holit_03039 [Hollandina sp. SP2]
MKDPHYLMASLLGKPRLTLSRGQDALYSHVQSYSRIPSGHPEGYFEALGNIYKTYYINPLIKQKAGQPLTEADIDFPNTENGLKEG